MNFTIEKIRIPSKAHTLKANWTIGKIEDWTMPPTTPWQYVKNWSMSDKDPEETLDRLNERMQNRWPGKYKIVKDQRWNGHNYWLNVYEFKFDTAAEETLFRIKYS